MTSKQSTSILSHTLFWETLKQHRARLFLFSFILLAEAGLVVLMPLPIRYALDQILKTDGPNSVTTWQIGSLAEVSLSSMQVLAVMSFALLVMAVVNSILEFSEDLAMTAVNTRVTSGVRMRLLNLLLTRKQSYIDQQRKMDIVGRISGDVNNMEIPIGAGIPVLMRAIPSLLLAIGAMFFIHWQFALCMTLLLPIFYIVTTKISSRLRNEEKSLRSKTNLLDQDVLQTLSAMSLVKSLTGEQATLHELEKKQTHVTIAYRATRRVQSYLTAFLSGSRNSIRASLLLLGGWAIFEGWLTLGTMFVFISYLESLQRPVNDIAAFLSRFAKANASLDRVEELYQTLLLHPEASGPETITALQNLEFDQVHFRYDSGNPLLQGFDGQFRSGTLVAVVGPSGAGKSTFIKLLNRLHDPTNGIIYCDLISNSTVDLKSLRQQICVMSQDPFFLAGTVRMNLQFALPTAATDEELWTALIKVNADEFVRNLPLSLDSPIGEGGQALSGGQSKRLSLARAFLRTKSASCFVFDEPTSGLDPRSAEIVVQNISELAKNHLVFWSTHRMDEVQYSDQVLFFQNGKNPRLATHAWLSENERPYFDLLHVHAPNSTFRNIRHNDSAQMEAE